MGLLKASDTLLHSLNLRHMVLILRTYEKLPNKQKKEMEGQKLF